MRRGPRALICAALACCGTPALAAPGDDIGATVRIVNLVTGEYAKDLRNLAKGDAVRQDELIAVSDDGIGEIRLNDDTELALGPGARLKLDQFVYNPDISGGAIVVDLVKGAFRFITGVAAKPAYVIKTPTASVTVRGTIFDVYVEASGISWLLLIEGAIEACSTPDTCNVLDEPGKLMRITPDGIVSDPLGWADLPTADLAFATAFPFIVSPPQVDPDPAFTPEDIVGEGYDGADDADDVPADDNGAGRDDDVIDEVEEDRDDDVGPGRRPPLRCWTGWKKVHKGWSKPNWRVKRRRRGARVIWCAHRTEGPDLPPKPKCVGGNTMLLKTLPPRWRCVCPDGRKRVRLGKHAYVCKRKPGGGLSPKEKCLKKGWFWVGGACIPKLRKCKKGYFGTWPNCKKIVKPPGKCPKGFYGKPPHCKPKRCKKGTVGKWPNCKKLGIKKPKKRCKPGYVGKWPNCKKLGLKKLKKKKKSKKKTKNPFKTFQLPKK